MAAKQAQNLAKQAKDDISNTSTSVNKLKNLLNEAQKLEEVIKHYQAQERKAAEEIKGISATQYKQAYEDDYRV